LAINPIFGSQLPDFSSAIGAQPGDQTATSTPNALTLQQLSDVAADVLLGDLANSQAASTGDPLLDDLSSLDTNSSSNPLSSSNQNLNAFLLQQATASFQASQAMDGQGSGASSAGNVLGNTSA
jgi:hypothetical protein